MRLDELYDVKQQSRNISGTVKPKFDISSKEHNAGVRDGKFSIVKPTNDPHTVNKSSKVGDENPEKFDPYWLYTDFIINNNLAQGNPYFPRVYKTLNVKDRINNTSKRAEIEKLIPGSQVSAKELITVFERISNDTFASEDVDPISAEFVLSEIAAKVYVVLLYQNSTSEDEQFQEWVKLTGNLLASSKRKGIDVVIDIHEDNIMFRRTQHGVQLVITDPFASMSGVDSMNKKQIDHYTNKEIESRKNEN